MHKLVASSPKAKIAGRALLAYTHNLLKDEIAPIARRHLPVGLRADAWYPQQVALDLAAAVQNEVRDRQALVAVGMKLLDCGMFPPTESFEEAINALTAAYLLNHRDLGPYDRLYANRAGNKHLQLINSSPYPDDLIYGYLYAVVQRHPPAGARPVIRYDTPARANSSDSMVYIITW